MPPPGPGGGAAHNAPGHRGRTSAPGRAAQPRTAPKHGKATQGSRAQPGRAGYALGPMAGRPRTPRRTSRATHGRDAAATRSARRPDSRAMRNRGTGAEQPRSPGRDSRARPRHGSCTREAQPLRTHPPDPAASGSREATPTRAGPAPMRPGTPTPPRPNQDAEPGAAHPRHAHTRRCPGDPSPPQAVGSREPRGAERGRGGVRVRAPRLPINHATQGLLLPGPHSPLAGC